MRHDDFHPVCPECGDVNFPRSLKCASCGTRLYLFTSSCVYCGWPTMYKRRECLGHCDLDDDEFASLDSETVLAADHSRGQSPRKEGRS